MTSSNLFAPPLKTIAASSMLMAMHFSQGRRPEKHGKVAWLTSGAPVELLRALSFYTFYPENHGAVCGASRQAVSISIEAENRGYSRDLCSYARTDLGSVLSGKTPLKSIPRPDLLMACTNICQTVLHWYRVLACHFHVPLVLIDTPFIYERATDHSVAFVRRQIEEAVPVLERVAGQRLSMKRFRETISLSRKAAQLWMQILDLCRQQPSPVSVLDQFIAMAPIVSLRGEAKTVDVYGQMLEEVKERVAQGIGALRNERKRLLWDNLPIWYALRYLGQFLGARGIVLAASTYTSAWGRLAGRFDPENPFESAARTYLHPILNCSTGEKMNTMVEMVSDFQLDGVILHSDRSCKPYSIGQMDQRDWLINKHGIPALLLEADHNDSRSFSEEQAENRLEAFCEMLGD